MQKFFQNYLKAEIVQALTEIGFQQPTEIQQKAIPFLLERDEDLIGLAQTGTGKTAAFSLPILETLNGTEELPQALIISPTRELALQIGNDIERYSKYLPNINSVTVYGGANIQEQIKKLRKQPKIIIGTPGRINDLIKRGELQLSQIKWLVLDEADEMLSMGFKEELESILAETPANRRTLLFSATMSKPVEQIAKKYLKKTEKISIGVVNAAKKNITHHYVMVKSHQKLAALKRILDYYPNIYAIIFCRTKLDTQRVADYLIHQHYSADALHGDLSQTQRDTAMKKFRLKNLKILVATDVAARGLDVSDLTHVIHYTLPDDPEVYVHRSGRTARAGKSGSSICIVKPDEVRKMRFIEKVCKIQLHPFNVPSNKEIIQQQVEHIVDRLADEDQFDPDFFIENMPDLSEISKEELFKRFSFLLLKETWRYYKRHKNLESTPDFYQDGGKNEPTKSHEKKRESKKRNNTSFERLFLNLGKRDQLKKTDIIDLVNQNTQGERAEIGEIDIRDKFSFFELEKNFVDRMLKNIQNKEFNGKSIGLERANK